MRLNDEQWTSLSRELGRAAARAVPSWTEPNPHDPGITLVTLFAFLAEQLGFRQDTLSPAAQAQLRQVAGRAAGLAAAPEAAAGEDDCGSGLQRPRYFAGQLLAAADFQAEQDYVVARLNRRNRLLHGAGIAAGLAVTVEPGTGGEPVLVIAPGLALDGHGREIHLESACRLPLPPSGTALWVLLRYRERPCRRVPAGAPPSGADADEPALVQPTRVVESFEATLAGAPDAEAVSVARLRRLRGRWAVDLAFQPPRTRR
ncbi:MAG TPA: hypothetical protein VHM00_00210 [Caldimonas sp.]|nr:hypothetical protein [Caldimonas sp.]HEX2539486.1 hypothetical protein [Caldimonas sp.]